jgi:hypothetical protein
VHWATRLATIIWHAGPARSDHRSCSREPVGVSRRKLARPVTRAIFSEPRTFADQAQRNGVMLDQRFCCSEWRHRSGFTGIFEIAAAGEAGGGRLKKETRLREDVDCRPSLPLGHPCCPINPRRPYLPKGRSGQRTQ